MCRYRYQGVGMTVELNILSNAIYQYDKLFAKVIRNKNVEGEFYQHYVTIHIPQLFEFGGRMNAAH